MSKSPLNHNPFGSIGKQMRTSKNNTSLANQSPGALSTLKSLTRSETSTDPLGLLSNQSTNNQVTSISNSVANNDAFIAAQQVQQPQVAKGTGLNTLTQGPTSVNTTDIMQEDASNIYAGTAFGNQAFTKKGSIIPNLITTKQ